MTGLPNAAIVILALPLVAAAMLAMPPSYRLSAALNVASAFVTFLASVSLLAAPPPPGAYILVDDLNVVFIVLNTLSASPRACSARLDPRTRSRPDG